MTNEELQALVQGMYDGIFNSATQAAPGGRPLMQSASTVLSLMKPGLAIRSADFRNPWTPGNTAGSKDAAVHTARLVDVAPKLSSLYTDSGSTITQIYKQILDGVTVPAQAPNPTIEKQLADASAVLWREVEVTDGETGEVSRRRVESQLYRDYLDNQAAYYNASFAYNGAYQAAQATATGRNTWPMIAPSLQLPVRQAYDRWRAAGADRVEQALAILNTSTQNALSKAWNQAKVLFEGYGALLDDSGSGLSEKIQRCTLLPGDWHSSSSTAGWTTVDTASGSFTRNATSEYTSYGGSAGFSLGIFSIGGSAGHSSQHQHLSTQTSSLRFSYKYTLVTIRRPWMTFNLLGTKGWNLGNFAAKGTISKGTKAGQTSSLMPLLPTSFVVVKDVRISANWAKSDWDLIRSQTGGGGGFGIGPFRISGHYAHSSSSDTFSSSYANGNIVVPGVQIIGWINQVVPYCPPA